MSALIIKKLHVYERFGAFLCHHKGGGGDLARFGKLAMLRSTRAAVFIDSDNLDDLYLYSTNQRAL